MTSPLRPFDESVRITLDGLLQGYDRVSFESEYLQLVRNCESPTGIVYVWNSEREVPRLHGKSRVLYIGKAIGSLSARYTPTNIRADVKTYWTRIFHILKHFGGISIDVYPTEDPKQSENDFMFCYFQSHLEMPPLNNKPFSMSLLSEAERNAFYGYAP